MDTRKMVFDILRAPIRWLSRNRLGLLVGCILFFLVMYVNLPGVQVSQADKSLGSIVLAIGLINFTYWTLAQRLVIREQSERRVKGRRK